MNEIVVVSYSMSTFDACCGEIQEKDIELRVEHAPTFHLSG